MSTPTDEVILNSGLCSVWIDGEHIDDGGKAQATRPASDTKDHNKASQELPSKRTRRRKPIDIVLEIFEITPSLIAFLQNLTADTTNVTGVKWHHKKSYTIDGSGEIALPVGCTTLHCDLKGDLLLWVEYLNHSDGGKMTITTSAPSAGQVKYSTNKLVFNIADANKEVNVEFLYEVTDGKSYYSNQNTKDRAAVDIIILCERSTPDDRGSQNHTIKYEFPNVILDEGGYPIGQDSEDITNVPSLTVKGTAFPSSIADGKDFIETDVNDIGS